MITCIQSQNYGSFMTSNIETALQFCPRHLILLGCLLSEGHGLLMLEGVRLNSNRERSGSLLVSDARVLVQRGAEGDDLVGQSR